MNQTKIEWVKNPDGTQGYTWNPVTGCLNHNNGLCKGGGFPCYAYKLANGRLRERYLANDKIPGNLGAVSAHTPEELMVRLHDPFYPRFWAENSPSCRLYDPAFRYKPSGIFVCDMGELFGDWVPISWQEDVFTIIRTSPQHRFYLLTKQPQNLPKWSPFPDNCWVGVTATNPQALTNALYALMRIEARVKFISFEPLLSWDSLKSITKFAEALTLAGIYWLIIGAQTKPYKPPKTEWVEEIVLAADQAGIPVFLKNNLATLFSFQDRLFFDYDEAIPEMLKMRQEMPK